MGSKLRHLMWNHMMIGKAAFQDACLKFSLIFPLLYRRSASSWICSPHTRTWTIIDPLESTIAAQPRKGAQSSVDKSGANFQCMNMVLLNIPPKRLGILSCRLAILVVLLSTLRSVPTLAALSHSNTLAHPHQPQTPSARTLVFQMIPWSLPPR